VICVQCQNEIQQELAPAVIPNRGVICDSCHDENRNEMEVRMAQVDTREEW
jgi:hypothetical protein